MFSKEESGALEVQTVLGGTGQISRMTGKVTEEFVWWEKADLKHRENKGRSKIFKSDKTKKQTDL